MNNLHYDIIIIGTGAGGGTIAHELVKTGKKILILERGEFLPQEKENWNPTDIYHPTRKSYPLGMGMRVGQGFMRVDLKS